MKVEFYKHALGKAEKDSVLECLDGLFLTTGKYVDLFEELFASYLGSKRCIGLNSCTAALHLSLLALGVKPGDEVITTPMTFIASATSIIHTGAKPVFVDVDPDTGLMDSTKIVAAITPRTKAILPVHLYGVMCDMRTISAIAHERRLAVVEDCAHCIEGERDGVRPGELSDSGCFSFYATKNLTSGEGGAVVCNNPELAKKLRLLRQHGLNREAGDRYNEKYQHWDMELCGWKYNMDNIHASLLLPQLDRIDSLHRSRRIIYEIYLEALSQIQSVKIPAIPNNSKSAHHLFTIQTVGADRDEVLASLQEQGVGVAVNYRAIHLLKYFRETFGYSYGDYPNAELFGERTISLPFWVGMTEKEILYVAKALEKACTKAMR
ncbi:MAG: DegT/DnrJ/EryC1/StrS aminotransferase family protein [Proteobacteria bacterium]|nr:DegT/DnrJ/EryC1/StrS aminotransferase family protein [Pseudomonadota bacterium]